MQAVILAAGQSSRFWPLNKDHKTLNYMLGKPLLYWTIKGLIENGVKEIMVVHSPDSAIPKVLAQENDLGVSIAYAVQKKPLGTGNTWWQARNFVTQPFFLVWGNKVNTRDIVAQMKEKIEKEKAEVVLVGAPTNAPWDYGVIRQERGRVKEIVENPKKGKEPSNIKAIGAYFLGPDIFEYYKRLPKHHEADSIDAINRYIKDKKTALVRLSKDVPALKYPWELFGILDIMFSSEDFKPKIAKTARVGRNVILKGKIHIGEHTIIKDNTIIEGPCYIGNNCIIGPQSVLRGPLNLEDEVNIGAFFEIKHSIVQKGTHFHSGYVGNSIIGANCRFGAGFISANKRIDRKNVRVKIRGKYVDSGNSEFGTVVGENTRFGIQTGTMPGILVGSDCFIGPGIQVFENVKDNMVVRVKSQNTAKKK